MFPDCYLNYENCLYRMPPMPGPGLFPGTSTSGMTHTTGTGMGAGMGAGAGTPAPTMPGTSADFETAPGSPTILDTEYTQGYLRSQIGKRVLITFLLGTNQLQDRAGILETVGVSYVILRQPESNNRILCDIYSIKFVTIYGSQA